ncbi:MAG: Fmu (Sun) domain protein [Verrucomicrobia bacterium]|nr:Fmu (Sun) domain protein [Verrucomicrobiota bacterium]
MSVVSSQQQVFLRLLAHLRPRWHRDLALPREIHQLLSRERSFGSRDRRLYRELIYTALRYLPWIEAGLDSNPSEAVKIIAWLAADTRDTRAFRAELAGDWEALPSLVERAAFLGKLPDALLPAWFRDECPAVFAPVELEALLARAPLWLRLQAKDPARVSTEFAANGWAIQASSILPSAWRIVGDVDVTKTSAYSSGSVEVQDLGSQLVLESVGVEPGGRWLDACAGAGGKSLQLSQLLGAQGAVEAHDIRPAALVELMARAARAGITNVRTVAEPEDSAYSGVLVDAPCSGSGTWRRAPHLKWATTPSLVAARAALQEELLSRFARCVRPGGTLVYATCSLARSENRAVVENFLQHHGEFSPAPLARTFGFETDEAALTILPARHGTDGFFVAAFRRR